MKNGFRFKENVGLADLLGISYLDISASEYNKRMNVADSEVLGWIKQNVVAENLDPIVESHKGSTSFTYQGLVCEHVHFAYITNKDEFNRVEYSEIVLSAFRKEYVDYFDGIKRKIRMIVDNAIMNDS
ncbi:hypothetical protein K9L97_05320 [Candidatus Woesearchaeota archaeon]|nr:hypothetical protein [Candidatus Woesearchaeota archaeon]